VNLVAAGALYSSARRAGIAFHGAARPVPAD
jgi:hypothetical protein